MKSNYSHLKRKEVAAVNTDGDCPPESGSEQEETGKVGGPCSNSLITSFLYEYPRLSWMNREDLQVTKRSLTGHSLKWQGNQSCLVSTYKTIITGFG